MLAYLQTHADVALAAAWIFSAIVAGMPDPDAKSGTAYQWAYKTLHIISANSGMWRRTNPQIAQITQIESAKETK